MRKFFALSILVLLGFASSAQTTPDGSQLGAWYMYFFNKSFENSRFGFQGDFQFRFWNFGSDLEQILLRGGATYRPGNGDIMFTLGYGNITTGAYGDSDAKVSEQRVYQEALIPQKIGTRFLLTHRFRYEQRWVEDQDFRTRFRYNIFINVPLNDTRLAKKAIYIAFYNELFINGQKSIGDGRTVEYFDRNRTYIGAGYGLLDNLRVQLGWMNQATNNWRKGQMQFSLHHSF